MTRNEYITLFEKYLAGDASEQEIAKIMAYKDDFEFADPDEMDIADHQRGERILSKLGRSTGEIASPVVRLGVRWYAAAAILIFLTTSILIRSKIQSSSSVITTHVLRKNDIKPGVDKAVLKLASGKEIVLSDEGSGTLVDQEGMTVRKEKSGALNYIVSSAGKANAKAGYNTLTTPRGAEYHITLEDGTKVWLNAASNLKFPIAFNNEERRVYISGEAYFEVAKNKHRPFKVVFNDQEIEVLGTHFNVTAYDDEPDTRTTLLEGSVKLTRNGKKQILTPGQQAVGARNQDGFIVNKVNVEEAVAWKNGFFQFRNASLVSIMRQASRWYDVDINYEKDFSPDDYGGRVTKYKNISELLNNLELTGTVHFKIDGRRITVMR
ncbi:FecR domain-containing protein [Mucilaginibacter daejeonensis]|uniref:FecR family protein n=1 Tax=Mucilaginibacter daejeonensis TaxID=398049 RepID=UPI001D175D87|nr:FecR family protein [Mucilaginibacter daejeonensis]UEG52129.1 FecR domain-containing protein [Mucilaginibacter daejeonensis]